MGSGVPSSSTNALVDAVRAASARVGASTAFWARKRGTVRRAGVEGTGTFGAGLSRYLLAQHVEVFEVNRPDRTARRLLGKSDSLDAQAAARAVLSGRARARAKSGDGPVHSARMYKLAKDSAVKARTQAINQLKAVLVIADPRPAGTAVEPRQCRAVPHLRALQPTRRWGRRGRGDPGHPHDAAHARRAHRTTHRTARRAQPTPDPAR
ncbi:transposase [Streptomyces sp. NPDC002130]|uniref:IS110 family transposase n=1 Tax=Streptomyces sp. NPDC002130 TaxID=3155568 RepID=UPI00331B7A5A